MNNLDDIKLAIRQFAAERDWQQYHSPKNLSMALSVEVAELLEHFQWLKEAESYTPAPETLEKIVDEIADVQVYLVRLADQLNIDILAAVEQKMTKNRAKYPADLVRGSAKKYSDYFPAGSPPSSRAPTDSRSPTDD